MVDLKSTPTEPGCYIYKDSNDKVIYVGKAKNLKKRVASYFRKTEHDQKTQCLIANIRSVDYIVTNNELEALILENTLIKKYKPKYNIHLKYSGTYPYIQLTAEKFPRLLLARYKTGKGSYFGPFVSSSARFNIVSVLNRTFRLRTCKRLPKKACLRYHIELCSAPCINCIEKDDYTRAIDKVKMVLNGKNAELLKNMQDEMLAFSKDLVFEKAMELRNQIKAVEILSERQAMDRNRVYNEDIINFVVRSGKVYLMLFNIYKGTLNNKSEYSFDFSEGFMEEFITRYYSENDIPYELILPIEISETLVSFLSIKKKGKVRAIVPQKGEKKLLMDLVRKNIEISFFGDMTLLEDLRNILSLDSTPSVIECFDISHISGTSMVGSMVQFRNAKPDKSNYRKFKIRSVKGVDDTKAIAEVVRRRYSRLLKSGSQLPDLIIIDGGKGQLNSAACELKKLELNIHLISIAKRLEEIHKPGQRPIIIPRKGRTLQLIQQIRDEAHRFAITYNRLLRSKEQLELK